MNFHWNRVVIICFSGETESNNARLMIEQFMSLIVDVNRFIITYIILLSTSARGWKFNFHKKNLEISNFPWLNK